MPISSLDAYLPISFLGVSSLWIFLKPNQLLRDGSSRAEVNCQHKSWQQESCELSMPTWRRRFAWSRLSEDMIPDNLPWSRLVAPAACTRVNWRRLCESPGSLFLPILAVFRR